MLSEEAYDAQRTIVRALGAKVTSDAQQNGEHLSRFASITRGYGSPKPTHPIHD